MKAIVEKVSARYDPVCTGSRVPMGTEHQPSPSCHLGDDSSFNIAILRYVADEYLGWRETQSRNSVHATSWRSTQDLCSL